MVIYPNDHRPAHVHVKGAAGEAVFILHCPDGPPALRESFGFNQPRAKPDRGMENNSWPLLSKSFTKPKSGWPRCGRTALPCPRATIAARPASSST
ncbi:MULTISPECIES: DUF4160 domain-containing protein [unclassified Mesorhizobium]|uniref:DUF4160 domain-containing protein n=1 Tax=unclassified Mesorhizobium TaxID=325217 RepID=UPI001FEF26DC|nr:MULTISPECIES: DUF4160 domain-containing protein [unclassified Mesorhizobium]